MSTEDNRDRTVLAMVLILMFLACVAAPLVLVWALR